MELELNYIVGFESVNAGSDIGCITDFDTRQEANDFIVEHMRNEQEHDRLEDNTKAVDILEQYIDRVKNKKSGDIKIATASWKYFILEKAADDNIYTED